MAYQKAKESKSVPLDSTVGTNRLNRNPNTGAEDADSKVCADSTGSEEPQEKIAANETRCDVARNSSEKSNYLLQGAMALAVLSVALNVGLFLSYKKDLTVMQNQMDGLRSQILTCFVKMYADLEELNAKAEKNPNLPFPATDCTVTVPAIEGFQNPWSNQNIVDIQCSELIPLPAEGNSIFVAYKHKEPYSNNERCLWTLDNTRNGRRFSTTTVKVTLLCDGFRNSEDALIVHDRKCDSENSAHSSKYSHHQLRSGEPYETTGSIIYLSFTSDVNLTGREFVVRIDVVATSGDFPGQNFVYSVLPGSAKHGPYQDYDQVSIVVAPSRSTQFTVNSVNLEHYDTACFDSLTIFQLDENGVLVLQKRLCDAQNLPFSLFTNEPVLALFTSDGSVTKGGFEISWT